jgi:ABC-type cobalamin transport system ATPase subunit
VAVYPGNVIAVYIQYVIHRFVEALAERALNVGVLNHDNRRTATSADIISLRNRWHVYRSGYFSVLATRGSLGTFTPQVNRARNDGAREYYCKWYQKFIVFHAWF